MSLIGQPVNDFLCGGCELIEQVAAFNGYHGILTDRCNYITVKLVLIDFKVFVLFA